MFRKLFISVFYRPKFIGQLISWGVTALLTLTIATFAAMSAESREAIADILVELAAFIKDPSETSAAAAGVAISAILLPIIMALKATLIAGVQSNKAANVQNDLGVVADGDIHTETRTVARKLTGKGPLARSRRVGPLRFRLFVGILAAIVIVLPGCTSTKPFQDRVTGQIEEWRELYIPVVVFSVHSGLLWFGVGVKKRVTATQDEPPATPPAVPPDEPEPEITE